MRCAFENMRKFQDFQAEYEGSIPFTRSKIDICCQPRDAKRACAVGILFASLIEAAMRNQGDDKITKHP
jgi:hypothetical protein